MAHNSEVSLSLVGKTVQVNTLAGTSVNSEDDKVGDGGDKEKPPHPPHPPKPSPCEPDNEEPDKG